MRKLMLLAVVLLLAPKLSFAQAAKVHFTVGPAPMISRADLFGTLASISVSSTNRILRLTPQDHSDSSSKGIASRAFKLTLFDLPVSWFFVSWNHEYGHVARATEANIRASVRVVGTPWSYPRFELEAASYPPSPRGPLFDLGTEAGGLEGSWVLKDRLEREAGESKLTVGEAIAAVSGGLNTPLYVLVNTPDNLLSIFPSGDVARYAQQWLRDTQRGNARALPERLSAFRRSTLLNLLDVEMVMNAFGIVEDYVIHGRETIASRSPSLLGVKVSPAVRYSLTPIGPEFSFRSLVRGNGFSGSLYIRHTESASGSSSSGAGGYYSKSISDAVRAHVELDFWAQPTTGQGGLQQAGIRILKGEQTNVSGFVDLTGFHKTRGYLEGYPQKGSAGAFLAVGFQW